jgi:hypothetical protein
MKGIGSLAGMFPDDPNSAIKQAAQLIQQNPGNVDLGLLQQVAGLIMPLIQQATSQQAPPQGAQNPS